MNYLCVALYLIILSVYYDLNGRRYSGFASVHRWVIFIIFVSLSGLRYRLAPDTVAYMYQFQVDTVVLNDLSIDYFSNARHQPLWVLINSFCKTIGNFSVLQTAVAVIFNWCVFYFFKNASSKIFSCLLFYYISCYFYFNMEIMRESLAIGLVLVSIIMYSQRRILAFYLWLFSAILFHQFAFLIVFATPLVLSTRIPLIFKVAGPVAITLALATLTNPLEYISSFGGYLKSLNLSFYDIESELSFLGLLYNLARILPIVIVLLFYRKRPVPDLIIRKEVLFPLCWAFVFIVLIRITSIPFMDRISNYFLIFVICCLSSISVGLIKGALHRLFWVPFFVGMTVMVTIFNIIPMLSSGPGMEDIPTYRRYYPYSSIFSNELDPDRERLIYLEAKE